MLNRIKVTSLFSGGGGLDLGFSDEGYDIIWANDNDKNAAETYKNNLGNHIVLMDINEIDINDIPKAEVVIGGPPCQSFSLSGNRDSSDVRGQLVWKYIEIINSIKPKAFVFENVMGLQSAKDKEGNHILPMLKKAFQNIGYSINTEIVNAANYGVPQKRKRVIIVGLKGEDVFSFPEPILTEKEFISVSDALDDLPPATEDKEVIHYCKEPNNEYQKLMRANERTITEHTIPTMSELDRYIVKHVRPGGNYMDIPSSVPSSRIRRLQKEGGRTTYYGRMKPENPSFTINTYFNRPNGGCFIHYSEDRLITIREALRLQGFPDYYKLYSTSEHGKRSIVGNAVPPLMSKAIAKKLKEYLEV